jgi:NADPH:quinone reductase-like Zn-dependent oxidoreductase
MTIRLMRSAVIDAPPAAVWHLLRDFNSHGQWHPAIDASRIEAGESADLVGAVRAFTLRDGSFLREQLIALSDREMSLTYCLLDTPIPLQGYVARMQLRPVTDGDRSFLLWESSFRAPAHRADELRRLVAEGIYEAGLVALQTHFKGARDIAGTLHRATEPEPSRRIPALGDNARRSTEALRAAAIVVAQHGGPEVLQLAEVDIAPHGPGEVRLRQTAIGVNFIDIHCRRGDFGLLQLPGTPGMEAVGFVLDVGPGVTDLGIGDRVVYAGGPIGAYAAVRNMPADVLVPVPAEIDDRLLAASYLKGITADYLLHDVQPIQAGEIILIRAAAGGLGLLLSQMAKALGATVIGVVSDAAKVAAAAEAGCDQVIVHGGNDLPDHLIRAVQAMTSGLGARAVFDGGGGASFEESIGCLAIRGHLVSLGQASGPLGARDLDRLTTKSLTLSRPNFAHYSQNRAERRLRAGRLFDLLLRRRLEPSIAACLPLRAAAEAHRSLEGRHSIGSFVLLP